MSTLVLTVGLPQSGKSTWAKDQGHPIVNLDAIRLATHGQPFVGSAEPFVWATAKAMVRSLFLAGHETVILDATNTTRKRRGEWKSRDWVRDFQVFDTPADVCRSRASSSGITGSHLEGLLGSIDRMSGQFEPVADDEESQ